MARYCLILFVLLAGCSEPQSFTQLKGFTALRNGLSSTLPTARQQQLLQQYAPLLYVSDSEPLDFYKDYIASGVLNSGDVSIANPSPAALNKVKNNPHAIFTHVPKQQPTTPVAYAAIEQGKVDFARIGTQAFSFLSYHFVFRQSGLAKGIGSVEHMMANMVGDTADWHQLDHYTAVFIVLYRSKPIAYMLQQHNGMRTYFIDELPISVVAAYSSNELYPYGDKDAHNAVGYMSKGSINFLLGLEEDCGIRCTVDFTRARDDDDKPLNYVLKFLPLSDAFYVFQGRLGAARAMAGRDGPPGALYRNVPQLTDLSTAFYVFYWQDKDEDYSAIYKSIKDPWQISPKTLERFKARLEDALIARGVVPL